MATDTDNVLSLQYIPLEQALEWRWGSNPKQHDIPAIAASILRYGFRDPSIYDSTLGAIPAGNGRLEAVEYIRLNELNGGEPPAGIALDAAGRWCVPIVFGVDADSQAKAEAFGVDHNNLTLGGSGFTAGDVARLWTREQYIDLLRRLNAEEQAPITVEHEDFTALVRAAVADQYDSSPTDNQFDAARLPGATGGETTPAFLIYVAMPDEESFLRAMSILTYGDRNDRRADMKQAHIKGSDYLERWLQDLGGNADGA